MAEARGRDINSLYGFEPAVNLTRLALSNNDISHVPELAAFTHLETLALRENYRYDVSSGRDIAIHPRDSHIPAIQARGTEVIL